MNENEILLKIKEEYQNILGEKLVGIYVHGSIVFGCFDWEKSDIDFLVVVNQTLTPSEKEALILVLLELEPYSPPKGLEMSVVLDRVCKPFVYPTPYELHFSNMHKGRSKADLKKYCEEMHGTDADLAAHVTVIRQAGQVLCGKDICDVFGEVAKEYYVDSIKSDVSNAKDAIKEEPVYYILNLCRVLAYLQDDIVLSKKQGGEWGVKNCPPEYREIVENALRSYVENAPFVEEKEVLAGFAEVMLKYF